MASSVSSPALAQDAQPSPVSRSWYVSLAWFGFWLLVILLSVPVIGVLCDKTTSRFGRRHTWAVIAFLVALVALGEADILVVLSAMFAGQVPVDQRGRASAVMGEPRVLALGMTIMEITNLAFGIIPHEALRRIDQDFRALSRH